MDQRLVDSYYHDLLNGGLSITGLLRKIEKELTRMCVASASFCGGMMDFNKLMERLKENEGYRASVYQDSKSIPTIGYGRNLLKGISRDEAVMMLYNDLIEAKAELDRVFPQSRMMDEDTYGVLIEMIFNMGTAAFLTFKKTLDFLKLGQFKDASREMLNSQWAKDVGDRAVRLSQIVEKGYYK